MPRKSRQEPKYEVIDEKEIKQAIDKIVDFCESQNMTAKVVMLAMDIIVGKIKSALEIEMVDIPELSKEIH
jgi:hypothetical protein